MTAQQLLLTALRTANAPEEMILKAERGIYGDFTSPLATPITQLVNDAMENGLRDIATRAMNGEFDGR